MDSIKVILTLLVALFLVYFFTEKLRMHMALKRRGIEVPATIKTITEKLVRTKRGGQKQRFYAEFLYKDREGIAHEQELRVNQQFFLSRKQGDTVTMLLDSHNPENIYPKELVPGSVILGSALLGILTILAAVAWLAFKKHFVAA